MRAASLWPVLADRTFREGGHYGGRHLRWGPSDLLCALKFCALSAASFTTLLPAYAVVTENIRGMPWECPLAGLASTWCIWGGFLVEEAGFGAGALVYI